MSRAAGILALWMWLLPAVASAHAFQPGTLIVQQREPTTWAVVWRAPLASGEGEASGDGARLEVDDACQSEAPSGAYPPRWTVECSDAGPRSGWRLHGAAAEAPFVVQFQAVGGGTARWMQPADTPMVFAPVGPGATPVVDRGVTAWLWSGLRHIAVGWDHLAYVGCILVLVVGWARRLAALTAFTVGHSLTLLLTARGMVAAEPGVVEGLIALSVVAMAAQALRGHERSPPTGMLLVALVVGLIHGLGFGSAFVELNGQGGLFGPLLGFSVGVELGQAAFVLVLVGVGAVANGLRSGLANPLQTAALYAVGAFASWETVMRFREAF